VLSFDDLDDRRTQLGQVVRRLAVKTLVHRHTELERDTICQNAAQNDGAVSDRGRMSLCRSPLALQRS